jgi:hypothetical protein
VGKHKPLVVELSPPAPRSPVATSDINAKTTASAAKQKAGEFVRALKTIKPDKSSSRFSAMWYLASDVFGAVSRDWSVDARNAFIFELGQAFHGTSMFRAAATKDEKTAVSWVNADDLASAVNSASDLQQVHWTNVLKGGPKPYDTLWQPADGVVVIPLTDPWAVQGYSVAYQMQAMHESGTAHGTENYVDVYVTAEAKFPGIPLVKDIISIDVRAGVKKGRKEYTKVETKDAIRSGPQVSKNFILQSVGRNSVVMVNKPNSKWEYLTIESGWQIVPKDGGATLGPFWPWYRLDATELPNSAFLSAASALEKAIEDAAVEIAKLLPLLQ